MMAAGICKQIQAGCELYREAKTQFVEIKRTADEVVSIGREAKGFVAKLVQFFAGKPKTNPTPQPVAKKKEKFVAVDEEQILNDVVSQLIQFFHLQEQLSDHIRKSEERSKNVYDPDANLMEEALKRVRAQDQMQKLVEDIRMAMTWNAPQELGALYSKVFQMRDVIKAEQDKARKKLDGELWLRKEKERLLQERQTYLVLTFLFLLYLWVLLAALSKIGNN
jgi:hypothetical protein